MPNRLINETSPYLLQHAHNPVDWYPWGDEALARAKALDKPILLSVGYSACHWRHVMERESFENAEIAAIRVGHEDGDGRFSEFYEPAGLSAANGSLYIADTNNHAIRVASLDTQEVSTLEIRGL